MDTTAYEIWAERDGKKRQVHPGGTTYSEAQLKYVKKQAEEYNAEEADNARMEMRQVRTRFYVVKAVTTRTEV